MRNALLVCILGLVTATSFGVAQSAIATNAASVSRTLLPVRDKLVPSTPLDSGPPGADEIQYDDGHLVNGWYFFDRRSRYAVRMDPAYHPAIVAQCDICLCLEWPHEHHESIYVEIWFDQDGDSMPDFPAVWSAWTQDSDSAPDTAAVTVPVPLGQIICFSGSFWVSMMMDTVHGGVAYQNVGGDSVSNYPEHQFYYYPPFGVWRQGIYAYAMDFMIRSWTMQQGVRGIVADITVPGGEIWAGDTVTPRVHIVNLGSASDSAWVWMRIEHACSTDNNYIDSCWVRLDPLQMLDTTYCAWTPLYPGPYRMQCTAQRNDTDWTYFTVLPREGVREGRLPLSLARNAIEVGPNPIRSGAAIRYSTAGKSRFALRILDARGRVVRTLVSGCSAPGEHLAVWDAHDDQGRPSPRGIYFVRLESQDCRETRKVILAR